MKEIFVVPDIHGQHQALKDLLWEAGIINGAGERVGGYPVVSIGDLLNATESTIEDDEETLRLAVEKRYIDTFILGNHEAPYVLNDFYFGNYYCHKPLANDYRRLFFQGKVIPSMLVGKTLLTHAGVAKGWDCNTAEAAQEMITEDWERGGGPMLRAISEHRGGRMPYGGILWSDYHEKKSRKFSQVFGHTPKANGPCISAWDTTGVFHVNIDRGAKSGLPIAGVWLDEEGQIAEIVRVDG